MGVILSDSKIKTHSLPCNWWNWQPTVELLGLSGIFDAERLEMMNYNSATTVSASEARAIASFLEEKVLPFLRPGERLMQDGVITDTPDDGTFYTEPSEFLRNYSASEEWLRLFAKFCRECNGFCVG